MTLIIAGGNEDFAFLASDRRYSVNGVSTEEEVNKSIILVTHDSRVMLAFTGLAKYRNFDTFSWIIETLKEILEKEKNIDQVLKLFAKIANIRFKEFRSLTMENKRLTVLCVGFKYLDVGEKLYSWRISNFEGEASDKQEFSLVVEESDSTDVLVKLAGYKAVVANKEVLALRDMLKRKTLPQGVEYKSYDIIRKASIRTGKKEIIGKQATTCWIPRERNTIMHSTYFSNFPNRIVYGVTTILAVTKGVMITKSSLLTVGSEMSYGTVPKVKHNTPCPCGSRVKYKRCHGNLSYPYLPLCTSITLQKEYEGVLPASGRIFIVESRGACAH